jgi:nucleotide-binding universal stress UspA family protein
MRSANPFLADTIETPHVLGRPIRAITHPKTDMGIRTILVELAVGEPNTFVLKVAADLASRFDAAVIGIACCQPMELTYAANGFYSADAVQGDRDELEAEIRAAEVEFRSVFSGSAGAQDWHAAVLLGVLAEYVSRHACEADLIITAGGAKTFPNSSRCSLTGDLIMQVGRPVLLLPRQKTDFSLDNVLVAWKDTREARRAIVDALPVLKLAKQVTVAQFVANESLAEAEEHLKSIGRWLSGHGITASLITLGSDGEDMLALNALLTQRSVDLVVAGAYGHSRMREWILGGVTRDLLLRESIPAMLSH